MKFNLNSQLELHNLATILLFEPSFETNFNFAYQFLSCKVYNDKQQNHKL